MVADDGEEAPPKAQRLMITADGGGSNGYHVRLWKVELQKLADELKLPITVCHLPPSTSKWNKIEHRLFSFITINWRGKPLRSYRTIVQLIAATTTDAGLKVCRAGREQISRRANRRRQSVAPFVPRRLELYDFTDTKKSAPKDELTELFMDGRLALFDLVAAQASIQWFSSLE